MKKKLMNLSICLAVGLGVVIYLFCLYVACFMMWITTPLEYWIAGIQLPIATYFWSRRFGQTSRIVLIFAELAGLLFLAFACFNPKDYGLSLW